MGARVYDPYTGTFLQTDPLLRGGANAYGYTDGDPVNQTDLSGDAPGSYYSYYRSIGQGLQAAGRFLGKLSEVFDAFNQNGAWPLVGKTVPHLFGVKSGAGVDVLDDNGLAAEGLRRASAGLENVGQQIIDDANFHLDNLPPVEDPGHYGRNLSSGPPVDEPHDGIGARLKGGGGDDSPTADDAL
jgi:uncharacterized protein RhaS with RHS repeats